MTSVLTKKEKFQNTGTQRDPQRRRYYEDSGGDWSYAATNQGIPRIVSTHQKLKETRKIFFLTAFGMSTALPSS